MTEAVKKTNRASRKRVAETQSKEEASTNATQPEEKAQAKSQPEEKSAVAAPRKDKRERRKMSSGAIALV